MSGPAEIWPGLTGSDGEGPYLVGGRCRACGAISFGMREICPQCWSTGSLESVPIGRTGRVYSRTVIHQAPEGFQGPMVVGYVDLPEGLRAFAHLRDPEGAPGIGEDVELSLAAIRSDGEGRALQGPVYRSRRTGEAR